MCQPDPDRAEDGFKGSEQGGERRRDQPCAGYKQRQAKAEIEGAEGKEQSQVGGADGPAGRQRSPKAGGDDGAEEDRRHHADVGMAAGDDGGAGKGKGDQEGEAITQRRHLAGE